MKQSNQRETNALIVHHDPRSPVSEAFRTLRTNLAFVSPDNPVRSILVSSPGPAEGKSTVVANLGISFAQAGRQAIIVDADLRKPVQHKLFSLPNQTGLTTALVKGIGPEVMQETEVRGLRVITTGPIPPNPSELLSSSMMAATIQALSSEADYVIYDTPPLAVVTDGAVLAPHLDGTLLVIRLGMTSKDAARRAKQLLENSRCRLLGIVLNDVSPRGSSNYYYYYYENGGDYTALPESEAAAVISKSAEDGG